MVTQLTNSVSHALQYAAKGFKVYPVQQPHGTGCSCRAGTECESAGKHPHFVLGGLNSATLDPDIIRTLFGNSEANVGLLCDNFFVLDGDGAKGLQELADLTAVHGELPRTPTAATGGGGEHYFFKADPRVTKNLTKIQGKEIDVRCKGGMVVVAPSLHVSGRRYEWIVSPEDCDLAVAPEWVIEFVTSSTKKSVSLSEFTVQDNDLRTAPGAAEGSRNDQLCRLVGSHLAMHGQTPDLLQLAVDWGKRCNPAMKESTVERTVGNLVAKQLANHQSDSTLAAIPSSSHRELEVRSFRDIEAKPVAWLWRGRFALGKITLLTGEAGVGKSMLTCDMAARISRGIAFPDGAACMRGDVFFIGSEDGAEDTVRPRLDAAGADVDRIRLISGPKPKGQNFPLPIDLSMHMEKLDNLLSMYPESKLLVIDPIMDYLGSNTNSDKATDVRAVLSPLRTLAEHHNVCVVIMNHLNKSGRSSKSRSLGSGAFVAVARVELRVCEDPEDSNRRLLLPVKNNLAAAPGLAYRIESASNGAGFAVWQDGTVDISIGEVEADDSGEDRSATTEAAEWLRSFLADGPVKSAEAIRQANRDGITTITLKRAKTGAGVQSEQKHRAWWWKLQGQSIGGDDSTPDAEANDDSPPEAEARDDSQPAADVVESSFTF